MIKIFEDKDVKIDLNKFVDSRALICANSGGGKSYTIRKLLEESHGSVQQIVLDMEGEFKTLREKYDYLLVGKEGDIPLNMKSAEILAKKVLELNISTIIDLYEMKYQERKHFVKLFLDAMMNAPKELWHPCIVVVDEAHLLCPEKGESEASSSVIDLCTRGRKRGFCGVLASQRIAKLSKDACAELNNIMIGRTGLDVDMKRASDILGFVSKQQMYELRKLEAGEFFVFGTAISNTIKKAKVGKVNTTHPKAGSRQVLLKTPPSSSKVKNVLKKLTDMPKEAEKELKDKQALIQRINELKHELRVAKSSQKVDEDAVKRAKLVGTKEIELAFKKKLREVQMDYEKGIRQYKQTINKYASVVKHISMLINKIGDTEIKMPKIEIDSPQPVHIPQMPRREVIQHKEIVTYDGGIEPEDPKKNLDRCARKIYNFLHTNSGVGFTKVQISVMTGYSGKSGGFNNAISALNSRGLIKKMGDKIMMDKFDASLISSGEEYSIDLIKRKLDKCAREIFEVLLANPYTSFHKEMLAKETQTQYSYTSGGFNNALSRLNSLGFIEKQGQEIRLNGQVQEMI